MSTPFGKWLVMGKWFVMGLTGVALVMVDWSGSPRAQVSEPSAFSETYGNWMVRCAVEPTQEEESGQQCAMEQRFIWRDEGSGQQRPLLTVTLTPVPAGEGMEAVVLAPFGLLFGHGLRLRADERRSVVLRFHTCFPEGCIARGSLGQEMIDGFRAGVVLHVEAEPAAGGESFRLEGSLDGFTSAHKRLLQEVESR